MAVTSLRSTFSEQDPRVRPVDFWRDGQSVAGLLELCFQHEGIDDSGHRLIHILRNYGLTQSWMMQGSLGFIWHEDGQVIGNASIQRNATRRDTWIIGNVATHPDHRGRGIATAVTEACVRLAQRRGARYVALQVVADNAPAFRMYRTLGFQPVGDVVHYRRAPVRHTPVEAAPETLHTAHLRSATWRDKREVALLAARNTPDVLTYSEPYDASLYRLGLRWSFTNSLNGNPEKWWVADDTAISASGLLGAVRTRVNYEGSEHHLELMMQRNDDVQTAFELARIALHRFEDYLTKPIYAAQARPHEATHTALQRVGFQPNRHLVHMRLATKP